MKSKILEIFTRLSVVEVFGAGQSETVPDAVLPSLSDVYYTINHLEISKCNTTTILFLLTSSCVAVLGSLMWLALIPIWKKAESG